MGIVNGFIGGLGNGMADVGKMMFKDKLDAERDEAEFLRKKELEKSSQAFQSSEAAKRDEASMARTKYTADNKASKASKPQLIKYTDKQGNEQQAVLETGENPETGKREYKMVKVGTGETIETFKTLDDLKAANDRYKTEDDKDGYWNSPEDTYGLSEKKTKAMMAEEAAKARLAKGKGIVAPNVKAKPNQPPKSAIDFLKQAKTDPKYKNKYDDIVAQFKAKYGMLPDGVK